jgi:Protein of unknown function (DUF1236)
MTNRLMMSVAAAALIAGTGFANAQGTATEHSAPSAEHAAPSAAPMNHNDAQGKGAAQSNEKMQPPGGKNQHAQDNMKANPGSEKSAQENNMKSDQPKGMRAQTDEKGSAGKEKSAQENNMKSGQPKGMNAQTEDKSSAGKDMKAEDRNGNTNADSKGADSRGAAESKSQTVGQAGAGGKLSGEQRTRISTVIRGQHVQPVTKVNFSISVGTRVPHEMSFHPLPPEVVTYYPEWRGYEFILVNDQIIVVDPRTFEIVAVIDA